MSKPTLVQHQAQLTDYIFRLTGVGVGTLADISTEIAIHLRAVAAEARAEMEQQLAELRARVDSWDRRFKEADEIRAEAEQRGREQALPLLEEAITLMGLERPSLADLRAVDALVQRIGVFRRGPDAEKGGSS